LVQIFWESTGSRREYDAEYSGRSTRDSYRALVDILRKEFGVFSLPHKASYKSEHLSEFCDFVLGEPDVERVLSAVELACRIIEGIVSKSDHRNDPNSKENAAAAIEEINLRFRQHGVGYQYNGEIIRIDSEFVHASAVKPVLALLRDPRYEGAEQEFLKAFEHYRKGHMKEALAEALKSIESTLKVICKNRDWDVSPNSTAKDLIDVCLKKGLIPSFWLNHFSGLRATLEGGVPTARNKAGSHGQGSVVQIVPDYLVAYVLHMTASTILFLVSAERSLEGRQ
jgi:hypothetical protein